VRPSIPWIISSGTVCSQIALSEKPPEMRIPGAEEIPGKQ